MLTLTNFLHALRYFFLPAPLIARAVVVALVVAALVGPWFVLRWAMAGLGATEMEQRNEKTVVVVEGEEEDEKVKGLSGLSMDVVSKEEQEEEERGAGHEEVRKDSVAEESAGVGEARGESERSGEHDGFSLDALHGENALNRDIRSQLAASSGDGHASGDDHDDLSPNAANGGDALDKDAQSQLAASSDAQTYSESSEPNDPPPYASRDIIALIKDTQIQHSASSNAHANSDSVPSDDPPPYTPNEGNALDKDTQSQSPVSSDTQTHFGPTESDDLYTRDFRAPHYYDARIANEERELRLRDITSLYDQARRERMTFKRTFFHPSKHQVTGFPPFFKTGSGRLGNYMDRVIDWETWADWADQKRS